MKHRRSIQSSPGDLLWANDLALFDTERDSSACPRALNPLGTGMRSETAEAVPGPQ